jgi:hypothetical protein
MRNTEFEKKEVYEHTQSLNTIKEADGKKKTKRNEDNLYDPKSLQPSLQYPSPSSSHHPLQLLQLPKHRETNPSHFEVVLLGFLAI